VGERVKVGWGKVGLGEGDWQLESSSELKNKMQNAVRKFFIILRAFLAHGDTA
jgi:hypothetical protein